MATIDDFKDHIHVLHSNQASIQDIRGFLRQQGVETSRATVSRRLNDWILSYHSREEATEYLTNRVKSLWQSNLYSDARIAEIIAQEDGLHLFNEEGEKVLDSIWFSGEEKILSLKQR